MTLYLVAMLLCKNRLSIMEEKPYAKRPLTVSVMIAAVHLLIATSRICYDVVNRTLQMTMHLKCLPITQPSKTGHQ